MTLQPKGLRYSSGMKTITIRRGTAAIAGLALCAVTSLAVAAPPPYVVVDIGSSRLGLKTDAIEDAGFTTRDHDEKSGGFSFTLGWRFTENIAIEGGFYELGRGRFTAVDPGSEFGDPARIRAGSTGVMLSVAGSLPVHERVALEARVGTYISKTQISDNRVFTTNPAFGQAVRSVVGSKTQTGLAAGVGAVVSLNERWALRGGYDYLDKAFGTDAKRYSLGVRFNWP
jgi:opacity protein-like surface antigen